MNLTRSPLLKSIQKNNKYWIIKRSNCYGGLNMIESNPEKSKLQILKMQIHESIMLMFENENPDFIRKNQILASNIKLLEKGIIKEWEKENITIKMFNEFLNEVYRSLKKRYR